MKNSCYLDRKYSFTLYRKSSKKVDINSIFLHHMIYAIQKNILILKMA